MEKKYNGGYNIQDGYPTRSETGNFEVRLSMKTCIRFDTYKEAKAFADVLEEPHGLWVYITKDKPDCLGGMCYKYQSPEVKKWFLGEGN